MTAVDIDELGPEVTAARIELTSPAGTRHVTARLPDGLVIAITTGAPIRVADAVMDRLAVPMGASRTGALPDQTASDLRTEYRPRYEPRNMTFADGLDGWGLGGSFAQNEMESHWQDYASAAEHGIAVLSATVSRPEGFAFLAQEMYADDYHGAEVVFRGQFRVADATDATRAGLFLRMRKVLDIRGPMTEHAVLADPDNHIAAIAAQPDWTGHEITARVPDDTYTVMFGIFLAGPGRIELSDPELTRDAWPAIAPTAPAVPDRSSGPALLSPSLPGGPGPRGPGPGGQHDAGDQRGQREGRDAVRRGRHEQASQAGARREPEQDPGAPPAVRGARARADQRADQPGQGPGEVGGRHLGQTHALDRRRLHPHPGRRHREQAELHPPARPGPGDLPPGGEPAEQGELSQQRPGDVSRPPPRLSLARPHITVPAPAVPGMLADLAPAPGVLAPGVLAVPAPASLPRASPTSPRSATAAPRAPAVREPAPRAPTAMRLPPATPAMYPPMATAV